MGHWHKDRACRVLGGSGGKADKNTEQVPAHELPPLLPRPKPVNMTNQEHNGVNMVSQEPCGVYAAERFTSVSPDSSEEVDDDQELEHWYCREGAVTRRSPISIQKGLLFEILPHRRKCSYTRRIFTPSTA